MNNQNIIFKLNKLENDMADLKKTVDQQNIMLKDLIKLLSPSFPTVEANCISDELNQAGMEAREVGIANAFNPDLLGKRDIPKVLKEVSEAFVSSSESTYPGPQIRLLGLLNHFKKEKGITGLQINDPSNFNDYNILKAVTRRIHDEMVEEIFKELRKDEKPIVLPLWSKVSSDIVSKYSFKLEKIASQHGYNLSRCQHSWASLLLLSETHKHRSNRSRGKAAAYAVPSTLHCSSSFSGLVSNIESVRREILSSDYVNLNFGEEFHSLYDLENDDSPPPCSPASSFSSFCPPTSSKRMIQLEENNEEYEVIEPNLQFKGKNRENKRKK